jgi:hypothetical protein
MVDASIRQMESFADLVAAVAKPIEQFTEENVTPNQARDWLVGSIRDLMLNRAATGCGWCRARQRAAKKATRHRPIGWRVSAGGQR